MRAGDFTAAWAISDAVLHQRDGIDCSRWPRHEQFVWRGQPLERKRVLVRCYHGLGDTIQFIRFLPRLKNVARETIVWAQPELIPLLQNAPGVDRWLPLHDGVPEVVFDVDVELVELPHIFRTMFATLPRNVPYLDVHASAHARGDELAVGLVWRSGDWVPARSIPKEVAAALARVPGVAVHVLQHGPERREWPRNLGVFAGSTRIEELAAQMRALDLVISIDSFPAHLAGALGVPTWTLLHHEPDWRWMTGREDSPWYPTMRLWRQARPGDWQGVIAEVAAELARLAAKKMPRTKSAA
jgi:hypothetical protein